MEKIEVNTPCGPVAVRRTERRGRTATVLLHGAAGSWTTWRAAIDSAESGGDVSDLVVPDLPGWGDSPADVDTLDAAGLAAAVAATVRALGYERWRLVGHSLGGFVALELAAQEPEATELVVLVSATTFGGQGDRLGAVEFARRYPALLGLAAAMRALDALGPAGIRFVRVLDRIGLLRTLTAPLFGRRVPDAVTELARDLRPAAFLRALACARRYPAAERWRRVRCPVLAVHGDHDLFSPASDDLPLSRLLPQLHSTVLPATGHFAHVEHPSLLAGALHAR
ncbi:alpha/beta fold hydrolase [Leifsonia sp. LS1]|uniref:alpha/beta fold hydrolase n=1 Tax=Leifsonia sp. LS1 TaxID=2828483 RepID=UPI001CFEBD04|nr:alpha/beta hydrolase [Leifsonia sp. LS1]